MRAIMPFDQRNDLVLVHEGHLHVQLRELRLPVGAQVFVAEALHDLDIAVHAGDHEDLLEELRRFGQRVERAEVEAAGHEEVARAAGRAADHDRRLDVNEAVLVEVAADALDQPMAEDQVALHLGAAQVNVAVLQPRLRRHVGGVNLERRRLGLVENVHVGRVDLDAAGGEFRVLHALRARGDPAADGDDELAPQRRGALVQRRVLRAEDDLRDAVAVAEVREEQPAVVAHRQDPAAKHDLRPGVRSVQFPAGVCAARADHFVSYLVLSALSRAVASSRVRCFSSPVAISLSLSFPAANSSGPTTDRVARAAFVRRAHLRLEAAALVVHLGADSLRAEFLRHAEDVRADLVVDGDEIGVRARGRRSASASVLLLERQDRRDDAHREPDAAGRRPAEFGDEVVVPPAAADRVARAQGGMRKLEHRPRVIIEPAHEVIVYVELEAGARQERRHRLEVRPAVRVEVIAHRRRGARDLAAGRVLAVEHAEHVPVEARLAVLAEFRAARRQELAEHVAIGRPAVRATDRVDLDLHAGQPDFVEEPRGQQDALRVHHRLAGADRLAADLLELPQPAGLRALLAEHRADVIELPEALLLEQFMLDHRAHDRRGSFGPERDRVFGELRLQRNVVRPGWLWTARK